MPRASEVTLEGDNRPIDAYLVLPDEVQGRVAAVIVVHEIWGLDAHIRDVAERFAAQGYIALAPDLYTGEWRAVMSPERIMAGMTFLRQAPPEIQRDPSRLAAELGRFTSDEQRALRTLMQVMSAEQRQRFGRDLVGAVHFLRRYPGVDPSRVAALGFCMGGGLAAQLAVLSPSLRAFVVFYGESPPLDRVGDIQAAGLGLYGGEDHRITDTVPDLERAMRREGKSFEYHVYPGAPHAFFNDTRPMYRAEAAADAWRRALAFFGRELGNAPRGAATGPGKG